MGRRGSFLTLLELVIVLAIILFMAKSGFKSYFTNPVKDKAVEKAAQDAGIDTTNYRSIIQSTKTTVQGITDNRAKDLDEFGNGKN